MHGLHAVVPAAIACLIAIGLSVPVARAQAVTDQSASASPMSLTLTEALLEVSRVLPLDLRLDPAVALVPVRVDLGGLPPYEQLRQVLLTSGVDFVVAQRGARFLVIAGSASAARPADLGESEADERRPTEESPVAADAPPSSAAPVEPEGEEEAQRSDGAAVVATAPGVRAPGEVSGDELVALLTGAPLPARDQPGLVELPFPDADGQPIRVWRSGGTPSAVELPFPDEAGNPLLQPVTPGPRGFIELPFPDQNGQPIRVPASDGTGAVASPTPHRVPGRPPGQRD
jgi:hypothetical protein